MRDRDRIREKALHAAATVTLAFSLGACVTPSSSEDKEDDDTPLFGSEEEDTDTTDSEDGGSGDDGSSDGSDGGDGSDGSDGTDTSDGDDDSGAADGGDGIDTAADGRPECASLTEWEDISACCEDLIAWCAEHYASEDERNECVYGPGYDGSTGCIPWGPPVPPRFSAALA